MTAMAATATGLDILRFPLSPGRRLIEASAGTGKTYTIAALYLRLVLGHGGDRPYLPEEILVMTFTNAATMELRSRIRQRLQEAAAFFAQHDNSCEPFLQDLRAAYPETDWPRLARRLDWAAAGMDQAAIYTIHAWAQRVLQEYAFAAGADLDLQLLPDNQVAESEWVHDYLRLYLHTLPRSALLELLRWGADLLVPEQLLREVRSYADQTGDLASSEAPAQILAVLLENIAETLAQRRNALAAQLDSLQDWLTGLLQRKLVQGRKLQERWVRSWLQSLREWADGEDLQGPDWTDAAWDRLSLAGMAEASRAGEALSHPALLLIEELRTYLEQVQEQREHARAALLQHALLDFSARKQKQREERGEYDFAGVLRQLQEVLKNDSSGNLAARLAAQYPWALVDEFQDTDPVQYAILEAVYGGRQAGTGLLLIGDPKQAIYAFRGADLPTYLRAQQDCVGEIYRLSHNYRSSRALMRALNRFFASIEMQRPAGVFGLRTYDQDPMPYVPVESAGPEEEFCVDNVPQKPLHFAILPETHCAGSKEEFTRALADACAERIVALLRGGRAGSVGFCRDEQFRAVSSRDIAVLVNNAEEARVLRAALGRRGVASTYLSERQSVYQTAEAADLEFLLQACLSPEDMQVLGAALATSLLRLDWEELAALRREERIRELRLEQFQQYGRIWSERGVLPMLLRLAQDFSLPARLLQGDLLGGERILTNFLHLAELLQKASQALEGEHALLRYLAEQREMDGETSDELLLRLESDADLVRVVTIHKSKGLQYPVVFLPFLLHARVHKGTGLRLVEDGDRRALRPASSESQVQAESERLQEDVRKLYVALTRAQFAVWVGVGKRKGAAQSALGHLLCADPVEAGDLPAALQESFGEAADITLELVALPARATLLPSQTDQRAAPLLRQARAQENDWWIASYSALHRGHQPLERLAESADEAAVPEEGRAAQYLAFAPGAATGILLHDLLRWMAEYGFADLAADPQPLAQELERRSGGQIWAEHRSVLLDWLLGCISLPMALPNGETCRLQDLRDYLAEFEFWLPLQQVESQELDQIIQTHFFPDQPRPALDSRHLGGMLKGFIDLVFFWRGRYYLLDYKSNFLGHGLSAYAPEALRHTLLAQRYDLQIGLYLVALRRWLQSRAVQDEPGGAVAVFLRGIEQGASASLAMQPTAEFYAACESIFCPAALTP
ncbi:exodeoxyribonuclease V subunit beta [Acidithiobacillus sp.]|uniref:exodeoxyribonuclease V subunit beta n=1 Tax=Acidithiobacillus sp. TaxID=1872118 RepID=UPI0032AFBD10